VQAAFWYIAPHRRDIGVEERDSEDRREDSRRQKAREQGRECEKMREDIIGNDRRDGQSIGEEWWQEKNYYRREKMRERKFVYERGRERKGERESVRLRAAPWQRVQGRGRESERERKRERGQSG
jgi:hypothetical protein